MAPPSATAKEAQPPPPSSSPSSPPLEILESGTGHGSLTLHLARAIQAANSTPPCFPDKSQVRYVQNRPLRPDEDEKAASKAGEQSNASRGGGDSGGGGGGGQRRIGSDSEQQEEDQAQQHQQEWDDWRASRNAIIHTIDVSPKFSHHAEKIVRGFRRGIYAGNVDFYVGSVESWIAEQTQQRWGGSTPSSTGGGGGGGILSSLVKPNPQQPFLSHAILDMPSAHQRIPHVAPILKRNGLLVVFMPSITQIGDCLELIRRQRLPFVQEKVVELGAGLTSGRLWDVRFAVKKSRADPASWTSSSLSSSPSDEETSDKEDPSPNPNPDSDSDTPPPPTPAEEQDSDSVLVCRPKVGTRIVGGGFVGIWRRIEDRVSV